MKKIVSYVAIPIWCVGIVSGIELFSIESKVLLQPDHPTAQYSRPMHLKGVVRYVTPSQEMWDGLAFKGFAGAWLLLVGIVIVIRWLEKRGAAQL